MQRTTLETHINFNRNPDTQKALTETAIADEANFLNQKVLKQLEVFDQNRLGKHLSCRTRDVSIIEKKRSHGIHMLQKAKLSFKQTPYAPIRRWGESCMDLRVNINNELRRIQRKIDREKSPARKLRLMKAYEDLVYTLKGP